MNLNLDQIDGQNLAKLKANQIQLLDYAQVNLLIQELSGNQYKGCEAKEDCLAIAYGAKACGGPRSYLIASRTHIDEELVTKLAEESTRKEQELNENSDIVSTCDYLMPPNLDCEQGLCQAKASEESH